MKNFRYILFITELGTHVFFVYKWIRILVIYILFINSVGYLNIFCLQLSWNISLYINVYFVYQLIWQMWYIFFVQFNNYSNKKNCPTHGFNPTQPNPCGLGWVGLDLCDGLGWVEFFLTHHGGLGQKIPSTWPMHTPTIYLTSQHS